MDRSRARIILAALLVFAALALVLVVPLATAGLTNPSVAHAAQPAQEITPTPTEASTTVAGSTDSIMWMGVVIVLIAVLPLLTRASFWR